MDFACWSRPDGWPKVPRGVDSYDILLLSQFLETRAIEANFLVAAHEEEKLIIRPNSEVDEELFLERRHLNYLIEDAIQKTGVNFAVLNNPLVPPRSLKRTLMLTRGRSFALCVDLFGKTLGSLSEKLPDCPSIRDANEEFDFKFPRIALLRNSIAHADERLLGRTRVRNKHHDIPLELEGAPKRALVGDSMFNDTYAWTISDGTVASIDVTMLSVLNIVSVLQTFYNSSIWSGLDRITSPS